MNNKQIKELLNEEEEDDELNKKIRFQVKKNIKKSLLKIF